MALTVLAAASKVYFTIFDRIDQPDYRQAILAQANLDAAIKDLSSRIGQTYQIIVDNRSPSKVNSVKDVLVQVAQVMQECAQFISYYSETKGFCKSSLPI